MPILFLLLALFHILLSAPHTSSLIANSGSSGPFSDGFGPGLYGPTTLYCNGQVTNTPLASYFARLPTNGMPVASLPVNPIINGQRTVSLGGNNGLTVFGGFGLYLNTGPEPVVFVIQVSDSLTGLSVSLNVTILFQSVIANPGSNFLLDSARGGWYGSRVNNALVGRPENSIASSDAFTLACPSGMLQLDTGFNLVVNTLAATPLSSHWGQYNFTVTHTTSGITQTFPFFIIQELPAIVSWQWAVTLYSNIPLATLVGTIVAFSDAGINTLSFQDGFYYFSVSSSGLLFLNNTLPTGALATTLYVTSKSGLVTPVAFSFTVLAGTTRPSTDLHFSPLFLDNHRRGQLAGNAFVSSFTPTSWTIFNRNNILDPYGGQMDLFRINSTGFVYSPSGSMLPGRTHQVTITATDGPNLVAATFDVPVTKKVGPVYHVGRGMSALYGAFGFEHFYDFMPIISGRQGSLPANVAGYTVNIHYDPSENYYANDNGLAAGDYNLRFGIIGPGTIQSADLTGPRPRVGGLVGVASGGGDMNGKGFFNIGDGDLAIIGLEISWSNGAGSPDTDLTHGISCIRKNAAVWGDFTLIGNHIHDCNNGLESGSGPYDVYIKSNVFENCGSQYVSSGATHGIYVSSNGYVEVVGNLFHRMINGHAVKSRAFAGRIADNRLYDGERGGASALIDLPNGGQYVVERNDIMKGPNAQSYAALNFAAEGTGSGRPHALTVQNNRFFVATIDGNHFGPPAAISVNHINPFQWPLPTFTVSNNEFFLANPATNSRVYRGPYGDSTSAGGIYTNVIESGSFTPVEPFRLNFSDPFSVSFPSPRPSWLINSYDGNGDNFPSFGSNQIDPGVDDIRVDVNAPVGTPIAQMRANGSLSWSNSPNPIKRTRVQPFEGTRWSLVQARGYYGTPYPTAPLTRYRIDPISGVLSTGQLLNSSAPGLDFITALANATSGPNNGTITIYRFYIIRSNGSVNAFTTTNTNTNNPSIVSSSSTGGGSGAPGGGAQSQSESSAVAPGSTYFYIVIGGAVLLFVVSMLFARSRRYLCLRTAKSGRGYVPGPGSPSSSTGGHARYTSAPITLNPLNRQ